MDRNTN